MLILADANAKLGSIPSSSVGTHAPDEENQAGSRFRTLLEELNMAVPQTFPECVRDQSKPTYTQCSAVSGKARIDFVAVPEAWLQNAEVEVDYDSDISDGRTDHHLVLASLQPVVRPSRGLVQRRRPIVDRALLAFPKRAAILMAVMETPFLLSAGDFMLTTI